MAPSYKFSVVQLATEEDRGERLNVGLVVFNDDRLDVRVGKRLEKVRAISGAVEPDDVRRALDGMSTLDGKLRDTGAELSERLKFLSKLGPLTLSRLGVFEAEGASTYEARVASILKTLVDAEPAPLRSKEKRSKLLTQMKRIFRDERVLAKRDEDLSSHRIVPRYEVAEGLTADLVLKNGAYHVVETVDASGDESTFRKAVSEIGVAALVLERARMKFGDETSARLVYEASADLERLAMPSLEAAAHQGATLVNWASAQDRSKFVQHLSSLATPVEQKSKRAERSRRTGPTFI
ncbi:Protein of unknown function [Bradyrhizobium sp. Ghvi]|uniref:DUF3037 domain-containing protein n=1 Tax=Bradyrhizobium sp. Ghvi TaxID=1855319 RepID=UPI0008E891D3|nr:DUF3037 domain-containing protein [Bradyrhizobium sp. Ghvi]SFO26078.1 Protein of unknown function [Bradyrhizobium sp. Ghvi]